MKSFIRADQFPYETATGWVYDSGDYHKAMKLAMEMADYDGLRAEQQEKLQRGEMMGIGVAFFTEGVGAGPRRHMDILGLAMNDGAELRVHPSGRAVVSLSAQTQGQGHETTFAQIVAEEIGIPPEDIDVVHGDTDQTPFGLGTYGSRSTPVSGVEGQSVTTIEGISGKAAAAGLAWMSGETTPSPVPCRISTGSPTSQPRVSAVGSSTARASPRSAVVEPLTYSTVSAASRPSTADSRAAWRVRWSAVAWNRRSGSR